MSSINRLNLTSSHSVLSQVLSSPSALSTLAGDEGKAEEGSKMTPWDELDEEERQEAFQEIKDTVDSGNTDLSEYRAAYETAYDTPTTLADDDIIWLIARYERDDPDMDAVVIAMNDAEVGVASGEEVDESEALTNVKAQTSTLIGKLEGDAEFKAEVELIVKSKEIVARGPVSIVLHLERIWDHEDWSKVPVPGTKAPEKGKATNITLWDITPTKRGNRKINVSWFEETTKSVFPKVWDDLSDINETFKAADERKLDNPQRREFMKLPPLKRVSLKSTFTSRRNAHLSLIKNAVRVRNLRTALKDVTNKDGKHPIACEFAWEVHPTKSNEYKGTLLSGSAPILVYDGLAAIPTEKLGDSYTVMTFLKFETGLKKMLSSGVDPSYTELDATLQRNREAMAAKKRAERFTVDNMADFVYGMTSFANYVDNAENLRTFKKYIEGLKKKNEADSDPRLMTEYEHELFMFGEMMLKLNPLYNYVKANGFDDLWQAHTKGEKFTFDDLLEKQDADASEAKAKRLQATG